jgi:putative spermidine/putrescine transport system ATP-binding protein
MSTADPIVRFVGIGKTYDGVTRVVDDLNLDVLRGEFLTLLGPSGSGKTTTLMMLAGFETPTSGEILLDGKPLSHKPPYQRDIGMVFQNYALFPHMTVAEHRLPAVGASRRRWHRVARRARARHGAARGSATADRHSFRAASSSGPRSARARVRAKLILMDEPLGALDKQLRREQLRSAACISGSA